MDFFSRTQMLLGKEAMDKIYKSKVAIFGVGGVGSYVVEALARTGVGNFLIVDNDIISPSNINRQIIATVDTIGLPKTDTAKKRILSINPNANVETKQIFFLPENSDSIDLTSCDYIVDAIDTVTAKLQLALIANQKNIKIISSLGTGNKLDPTKFEVDDIYNTSICPLAKVMRKELKKRGIKQLKVVYSKETPIKPKQEFCILENSLNSTKRTTPGSIAFIPSIAGLIIASEVIKELIKC